MCSIQEPREFFLNDFKIQIFSSSSGSCRERSNENAKKTLSSRYHVEYNKTRYMINLPYVENTENRRKIMYL